ncbi:conserved hypothetical protein [Candidatus Desulfarcum epimagneticum]|uniref:Sulfotransferase family protein n=1 Tax=uncultured Desulfobacteraceae bacterium TaxID=218296 RepID=A0A484HCW6_9BACT|nr:conserved hypothetical protein [uncultured Desulfobacteraceae bacterium]
MFVAFIGFNQNKGCDFMRKCILVLGMHRSGTSALAGILDRTGIHLGPELLPPGPDNPKGYYENKHINLFNEKILKQVGSSWDDLFFSDDQIHQVLEHEDELKSVISEQFGDRPVFAIKDPRICLLFPLYERVLKTLGADIHVLMAFRHPLEAARSLEKRNGFSIEKGLLLWAGHFLRAEYHSRPYGRIWIDFDDLVKNPCLAADQISGKWGLGLSDAIARRKKEIEDFIDPGLKHHHVSPGKVPGNQTSGDDTADGVPDFIQKILKFRNDFDSVLALETLDSLRREFSRYEALLHPPELKKLPGTIHTNKKIMTKQAETLKANEKIRTRQAETLQVNEKTIAKQAESLEANQKTMARQAQTLQDKENILARQSNALESKKKAIAEQSQILRAKKLRIQDMENSLSWRLSKKCLNFGQRLFFMRPIISKAMSFDKWLKARRDVRIPPEKKRL